MMFSKKILLLVILSIFLNYGIALSQNESFLKKGFYYRGVQISNPETSPLAEVFLKNGIDVTDRSPHFYFKTTDTENKFIVFIYYRKYGQGDFVGKFVYEKNSSDGQTNEFINAFVSWMFKNAWSKK
jgi:hypothetical protein